MDAQNKKNIKEKRNALFATNHSSLNLESALKGTSLKSKPKK